MASAATSASWSALRASAAAPPGSMLASATPASAATTPTHCSVPGRSPSSSTPAATGTIAQVATIGATMLIVPSASAR